jgi:hypothetical protein
VLPPSASSDSLKIFISYSHEDANDKNKLETHLRVLESIAPVETWTDTGIRAGQDWQQEIDKVLDESAVAVLLVTANFLTSKFINVEEVPKILARRKKEGLSVFPIIGRPCAWKVVPWLESMQVRPKGAEPVWRSEGRYVDEELTQITYEIAETVKAAHIKRRLEIENAGTAEKSRIEQLLAAERKKVEQTVQQNRAIFLLNMQDAQQSENQKKQMERWKILQDTQTKIFEINRSVAAMQSAPQDAAYKKWDKYIQQA